MERVKAVIEKAEENLFIITHGTYTMQYTARYLKNNLKRKDAIVLLTGSMIPLAGYTESDAPFNLGFSISEIFHLKQWIYVCMNGRIFDPDEIAKIISQGRFVSIFSEK